MQRVHHFAANGWHELELPTSTTPLPFMPHVTWGEPAKVFSPSFWRYQHWVEIELETIKRPRCRLGAGSLKEEVVACLLGGHGLPAETSLAYFHSMKLSGFFEAPPRRPEDVQEILKTPVMMDGSPRRYRFWKTKGDAIFSALSENRRELESLEASPPGVQEFRERLTRLRGIGLKTASWICRNWLNSQDVAVIDIHILRSLAKLGCPIRDIQQARSYFEAERHFIALSRSLGTPTQSLDLVIWAVMRQFPSNLRQICLDK